MASRIYFVVPIRVAASFSHGASTPNLTRALASTPDGLPEAMESRVQHQPLAPCGGRVRASQRVHENQA